ncbi:unnamed protein product [Phyllotreta striolata]|uniref:Myb-like domain-containing protein n=1 Tax=Phyllotreta striolata TaxID=444603 RepID=A0A9N9TUT3_PHYSR|nr:unnamed protein product [Phyllotreta striolata]
MLCEPTLRLAVDACVLRRQTSPENRSRLSRLIKAARGPHAPMKARKYVRLKMATKCYFSIKEDEKLVESVSAFPVLYDSEDREYKDRFVRDNCWAQISAIVERPTDQCKKRWRNIKDTYLKVKRNQKKSNFTTRSKSKWALLDQLTFLDKVPFKRRTQKTEETVNCDNESNDGHSDSPENSTDCSDPLRPAKRSASPSPSSKRRRDENFNDSPELLEQDSRMSDIQNISWKNDDEDPVLLFFKSMALTVKTFEPHLIPEVKSRIFGIVNEFETKAVRKKCGVADRTNDSDESPLDGQVSAFHIENKYSLSSSFQNDVS